MWEASDLSRFEAQNINCLQQWGREWKGEGGSSDYLQDDALTQPDGVCKGYQAVRLKAPGDQSSG